MRFNHIIFTIVLAFALSNTAYSAPIFQEIASGFDISSHVRPAIANNGNVAFIAGVDTNDARVVIEDMGVLSAIDLSSFGLGLELSSSIVGRSVQIRDEGDVVFLASKTVPNAVCFTGQQKGAYATDTAGSFLIPYVEGCFGPDGSPKSDIAMSENGTVAFSSIKNGDGSIYRGSVSGPIAELRNGSGIFFNTRQLDVNNAGRVPVQMEYVDGFVGGLMRSVLLFDSLNQDKEDLDVAIEKMGIGDQPAIAINASGQVALSFARNASVTFMGGSQIIEAGVYVATPNPFNSALNNAPTNLVKIADTSGDYCSFGNVDINDDGRVVFEAKLDDGLGDCLSTFDKTYDGIFMGEDSVFDRVVTRGDDGLGTHEFFDSVRLGELNNQGQVTLLSTYSEPLVEPVKVWRVDLNRLDIKRFWEWLIHYIFSIFLGWW